MSEHKSSEFGTSMSVIVGVVLLIALVYTVTVGRFAAVTAGPGTPDEIAARIAPIGKVKLAGGGEAVPATPATAAIAAAPAAAAVAAAPAAAAADEGPGAAIYGKACFACHATGAAGAPKLGDGPAWQPRLAQGIDQLMFTVVNGKGAMPPRGTCAICSDDDLRAAVEYMVSKVM